MQITRRQALQMGLAAGVAAALPWRLAHAQDLVHKTIPSGGKTLPVIGIGTARRYDVGESAAERAPLREVLAEFTKMGGRVIDTAPTYGRAEQVSGELVRAIGNRDQLFIATKVSLRGRSGREAGIAQMKQSMRRFGTERIDLMQVHNLNDWRTQLALMREWKAAGRLGYVGITTSFPRQYQEFEQVMREESLDFIQVDYAIDNRDAEQRILPLAADRGMAVLINLPYSRSKVFSKVKGHALPTWAAEFDAQSWGQFFLKFVISHPAVTCAIPATSDPEHLVDNMGACVGKLPDESMRRRMAEHVMGR
jgi:aryl-alcohol dehydrogenase-like predicted oxidoreductase